MLVKIDTICAINDKFFESLTKLSNKIIVTDIGDENFINNQVKYIFNKN